MIKKMFLAIIALAVMALGLVGVSTSASAVAPAAVVTSVQPAPQVASIKYTAKSVDKAKKFADCIANASRVEQPAPPRDPKAYCANKVHLFLKGKALAQCPAPNEEIRAWASVRLNQRLSAKALSKSVANGRVRVAVKTAIRDRAKVTAKAAVTCPSSVTPPPKEMITVCELSSKQIVTIYAEEFNPAKYSKNLADCASSPNPAPQILEVESVNFVLEKNTRTIAVTGKVASGHTANLFATADNGGTIVANKSVTVSGSFTVKVTYMAPAEIPPANTQKGVPQGHDRVTFILTQDDGQSVSDSTNLFEIRPAPVDPL